MVWCKSHVIEIEGIISVIVVVMECKGYVDDRAGPGLTLH